MGWAVGDIGGRHIGYGVPAICDHPGCGTEIDRGFAYACGGGVMEDVPNCGLFFCTEHLSYVEADDDEGERQGWVCERCATDAPPFDPTPDTAEWLSHVLTDESWEQWRIDNPGRVESMTALLGKDTP